MVGALISSAPWYHTSKYGVESKARKELEDRATHSRWASERCWLAQRHRCSSTVVAVRYRRGRGQREGVARQRIIYARCASPCAVVRRRDGHGDAAAAAHDARCSQRQRCAAAQNAALSIGSPASPRPRSCCIASSATQGHQHQHQHQQRAAKAPTAQRCFCCCCCCFGCCGSDGGGGNNKRGRDRSLSAEAAKAPREGALNEAGAPAAE